MTISPAGLITWEDKSNFASSALDRDNIYIGNASNVAQGRPVSGDITITNTGTSADVQLNNDVVTANEIATGAVTSDEVLNNSLTSDDLGTNSVNNEELANDAVGSENIINGTILDEDINASAAIAGTKISPDFGMQNITTDGNVLLDGSLSFDGGTTSVNNISTDLSTSAAATDLVTAEEVKDYVDTQIAASDDANEINYSNATSGLTATHVQDALDEIDGNVDGNATDIANLETLSGVAGATDLGTFSGGTIADNNDIKGALQEVETAIEGNDTDIAANATDIGNLETLSGAGGATDLGTGFTGSTITDNTTITGALQDLETALETAEAASDDANEINYSNATSGLTATHVQDALDEIDGNVDGNATDIANLETLSGVAGATDLGTFSGGTIADNNDIKGALQEVETAIEGNDTDIAANATDIGNLETLSGAGGATDLGTGFTGSTITDNTTIAGALQDLETALETAEAASDDANEINYANATSGLTATHVQDALDEIDGNVDGNDTNIANLETLSGAGGATDLGTGFTGSTITDNTTITGALQDLETALETAEAASDDANEINYSNATSGLTATHVQDALDEIDGNVDGNDTDIANLETLSGVAGATDLGTFSGGTIADNNDVKGALQEVETAIEGNDTDIAANAVAITSNDTDIAANATDIGNLETLSGAGGATDLGTGFTGSTITDNTTITGALQDLETALETAEAASDDANEINYSNATSGLTATHVQDALDEIDGNVYGNDTDIAANATDISNLETLSGVAGATDLGTFSGGTIADNNDVKGALQEVETAIEGNDTDIAANAVAITSNDTDIAANATDIGNLETLSGAGGATDLGTGFTGSTITDNTTIAGALQDLETALETAEAASDDANEINYANATSGLTATHVQDALDEIDGNVDGNDTNIANLETLSGAGGATDLGTGFTGSTITDNTTITGALQDLETALETAEAASDDANEINYSNATSGLTATHVQDALDEIDGNVDGNDTDIANLETLSGVAGATDLGTFSGGIIADNNDVKGALQEVETAIEGNDTDIAANAVAITSNDTDIGNLETLSGAGGATDLGTGFTGSTITDNTTITGALQDLETALETAEAASDDANEINYANATSGLTATHVQDALDEIDGNVDGNDTDIAANTTDISNLETLSGVAGATDLGTFSGGTIADNNDVKGALQEVETAIEGNDTDIAANAVAITSNDTDIGNLETLSGAGGATDLGTGFTGSTITNNTTIAGALQDLETALETAEAASDDANEINYSNATSGLTATHVQDALDEIDGNVDGNDTDIANLETLSGVAGATDLGTGFTGSTITDNTTITGALQDLETALETAEAASDDANEINYSNATSGLTATHVQDALDEIDGNLDGNDTDIANLETLTGVAGATDLGTFSGGTIADNNDVKGALQEVETAIEGNDTDIAANATDIGNLETLSGAGGATDLGTGFTGSTITDNTTIAGALQDLETALETAEAASDDANEINYSNATSGLTATHVQDALDEIDGNVDGNDTDIANLETLSGVAGATALGTFSGGTIADNNDVKGALQEVETAIEGNDTDIAANAAAITSNNTDIAANATAIGGKQDDDPALTSISGLTTTSDQMIYTTGSDTYATTALTTAGRAILDDADASAQRATLGLGTISIQDASSVNISGGTITGITDLTVSDGGTGTSSFTSGQVLYGNGTGAIQSEAQLNVSRGGTGIDGSGVTDGQLLIGNDATNSFNLTTITGTSNQVTVTNGAGAITLSTPQDIHTGASPTFNGLTISSLGGTDGQEFVDVNGTAENLIISSTGVFSSSDSRLKENIELLQNTLDKLDKLGGYNYNYKADREKKVQIGVIAQELEKVYPELVSTREDGYKMVNYQGLIPVLMQAIKEQQLEISQLNQKLANQESKLSELSSDNEAMKKDLDLIKKLLMGTKTAEEKNK